ncbi:glycosyltransferase family 2 protein [Lophiostoma macrostomum CBS 122681]|uniref:chitin synthase n=1 Tax=Lophiostoma macrostomum CBS 122681 TaxID=1314788 RepID=A0A6A6SW31_9PLEO|nr:glycosyltransferase family 2 protein [Lophiostoma macrostomum CBS 122681]
MTSYLSPENPVISSRPTTGILDRGVSVFGVERNIEDGSAEGTSEKLFACPYLKRDLDEYAERQSCSKSGWTSIHGLRQHVYRCHILPITCPSCSQTFDSSRKFTQHLHEASQCDSDLVEADEPIQGLETLIQKIKSPKTLKDSPTEEAMWKVIYSTLFPEVPKEDIPYPYHENHRGMIHAISPFDSTASLPSMVRTPDSAYLRNSQRGYFDLTDSRYSSYAPSISSSPGATRPTSLAGDRNHEFDGEIYRAGRREPSNLYQVTYQTDDDPFQGSMSDTISGRGTPNIHAVPEVVPQQARFSDSSNSSSTGRKLQKKIKGKTMEAKVLAFRAWEKPHRTDEHITPGTYRGFWKSLARIMTFYIPSWFLKKCLKMDDLRQRLAFRQKVFFCLLLFALYGVLCYFLVIQPILSCVVKVHIGMISNHSPFCSMVRDIIYVYMGLGGLFMLIVMVCVCRVRYTGRKFEEHDALLVMQIPCYNEDESTMRKTIESCVQSSYATKRKLLYIVADGTVAAAGQKPTYQILLEDIFPDHKKDLEIGIGNYAHAYTSFDALGQSENRAYTCTGHYRGVPYVLVVKVGREDEQGSAKPGNRGKRDSQLVAYNFFHYVNYRKGWSPLFENLEFQMRVNLNIDAREAMYMLAIDCDTEVDRTGISYLVDRLQKNHKLIGVCGYTGVGNGMSSFVASAQVFEYWLTHAVLKAVETVLSSVFVLSGCFSIYRLKWPNNRPALLHPLLLEDYGGSYEKTLHEHNLLSIGEDRYLSTLAIRYFGADCSMKYFSAATCTTVVPDTLGVLLDQRRRWTNSLIHCHFAHLNVMPFEASLWTQCRLLFVLGAELFMVFVLPLALPAGLALAIISVLLTPYAWAILLAFLLIPVFLCMLCMAWTYIPFYLPFFPMIFMFSVVIPIHSVWNQDNIKWGKTRGG